MNPLRTLLVLLCLAITPLTLADERLMVQTGREVFGLFPTATPDAFIKRLGAPTARIALRNGREGLLYGNSMLLVFAGEVLQEVRCWKLETFTEDLFLGWLQAVEYQGPAREFGVDDQLWLGQNREAVTPLLVGLEGSGDERSDLVLKNGSQVWLGYAPPSSYRLGDDDEQRVLVSITVHFNQSP